MGLELLRSLSEAVEVCGCFCPVSSQGKLQQWPQIPQRAQPGKRTPICCLISPEILVKASRSKKKLPEKKTREANAPLCSCSKGFCISVGAQGQEDAWGEMLQPPPGSFSLAQADARAGMERGRIAPAL